MLSNEPENIYIYLLENLNGEKTAEESRAAHPKAGTGCSVSGDFAIGESELMQNLQREVKNVERERDESIENDEWIWVKKCEGLQEVAMRKMLISFIS